ncbi:MAG: ribokinase [Cyclobacteriaceae bacterium]|nr:MAG: ribokinase [Cyclobacteriaceae bacterium]
MSRKIAIIGSSNIDLIMQVPKFPAAGETVSGGVFTQTFGGKGANQAVAASRAGGDVIFVTCLGTDHFAELIMERFEEDGIDTTTIFQDSGVSTGTAMIMVDQNGENIIAVAPGANFRLNERHLAKASLVLTKVEVVLLQGELHPDMLKHVLRWCAETGKKVLLNMAPAQHLEAEYLKDVNLLLVNETEAEILINRPVKGIDQAKQAGEELSQLVKGGVIVSLGENGSYVVTKDLKEIIPAFKVKAVDTTAAGDVYCGTLATALVEGMEPKEAVRFASAAAAISVTRLGAQPSIPHRKEIEVFLSDNS